MSVATRPQQSLLANVAQSPADQSHGAQRKPVVREACQTRLHPELTRQRGEVEGLRVAAADLDPPHMGSRLYADTGDVAAALQRELEDRSQLIDIHPFGDGRYQDQPHV